MAKTMPPGTMAVILVLIVLITVSAGCMSEENPGSYAHAPPGESAPAHSPGIIQTPVTPGTTLAGDHYPGVSSLITPNESNIGTVYMHPPIPDMWTDPFPREEVSSQLYVPLRLPEGFSYNGGSYTSGGSVWLRVSDSTTDIIYVQAPGSRDPGVSIGGDGVIAQQIYTHDRNYTYKESGTQHQLSWNTDDLYFYVTGERGPDELLHIAGSVAPVSGESLRQLLVEDEGPLR